MSEPEWSLPMNRADLIARVEALEAALREIVGNGNAPPASRQFKTADYRAGYVSGYLAQAEIAKGVLTPSETQGVNPTHQHREFCGALRGLPCICDATPLETLSPSRSHPSHKIRFSDASTFDEICEKCGCTDASPAGTYGLSVQCLGKETGAKP